MIDGWAGWVMDSIPIMERVRFRFPFRFIFDGLYHGVILQLDGAQKCLALVVESATHSYSFILAFQTQLEEGLTFEEK